MAIREKGVFSCDRDRPNGTMLLGFAGLKLLNFSLNYIVDARFVNVNKELASCLEERGSKHESANFVNPVNGPNFFKGPNV